jgi:hypothetical protein
MVRCRLLFILCLLFFMTGCAGHQMALTKGQSSIDVTKKSLALLSVKISNQYKPNYQFFGGIGLIAYVILWICMPSAKTKP